MITTIYIKKFILFVSVIAFITFGSCKEVDKLTHFYIDSDSSIIMDSTIIVGIPFNVVTERIVINIIDILNDNNTNSDNLSNVILKGMNMSINSTSNQSFNFLTSIEIYICVEGLDDVKIAWYNDIPQTELLTIKLETGDDNIKDYLLNGTFSLRCQAVARNTISSTVDINLLNTYYADAYLLGI